MKKGYFLFIILFLGICISKGVQGQDSVKVDFTGMTPHIGQNLYLRVVNLADNSEVGRAKLLISTAAFSVEIPGLTEGGNYNVDFWADLNKNGKYDSPPADHAWRSVLNNVMGNTTIAFAHNTSFTEINWPHALTVDFSAMNPHVGENLYLALINKTTGKEKERMTLNVTSPAFNVSFMGITPGDDYDVDFWADHSKNGKYDAPPVDHAWRITVNDIKGDSTVSFVHNTIFTDIKWSHELTVAFSAMNPHVGENLYIALKDKTTGKEIDRKKMEVTSPAFDVSFMGITPGDSYDVDFWADHSKNGKYDAPPIDHAWRLSVDNIRGDSTITFVHNTGFTDIEWNYGLTLAFGSMNPHVGQNLYLLLKDKTTGLEKERKQMPVSSPDFDVTFLGIIPGDSYDVDFFADLNKNGIYDAPPTDHAWRLSVDTVKGDTTVSFVHNTNFTDIKWETKLNIEFSNMTPHVGQNLYFSLIDKTLGTETERRKIMIDTANFTETFLNIKVGDSYDIDFFADLNKNGLYDAPPADHAWRLSVESVKGDTTLHFVHNTTFTDIKWNYELTIAFSGMNPHVGENLYFSLVDKTMGMKMERRKMMLTSPDFNVGFMNIMPGDSYDIDFWADHSKNGKYDAPPTDHAWRLSVADVKGDTTIPFIHNTNFTDIQWMYLLTVNFTDMTPHVGQLLKLYLRDHTSEDFMDSVIVNPISTSNFSVQSWKIMPGNSYNVDFFADLNGNGLYNAPPVDHAWRLPLMNVMGDTVLNFAHNTNFTDIFPVATNGINELNGQEDISLYPNPAGNILNIYFNKSGNSQQLIKVFNSTGALVKDQVINVENKVAILDLNELKPGLYILKISDGNVINTMKFIRE